MKRFLLLLLCTAMLLSGCNSTANNAENQTDETVIGEQTSPSSDTVTDTAPIETEPEPPVERYDYTIDVSEDSYVLNKDSSGDTSNKNYGTDTEIHVKNKGGNLVGNMASQGTTPRQLTDLIGSLCDLTSGSGDKGTPVVLVQGYFDNYTN